LWRLLVAIAVSYFLIVQSLFVGLVGFRSVAADSGSPSFELCRITGHDTPLSPGDAPDRHAIEHCMLCCAASDVSIGPPPQSSFCHVIVATARVWHLAGSWRHRQSAQYSIARPRGPPPSA